MKHSIYVQLLTRLRSHATKHHKLIMSTNPDTNWIRTEVVLKADVIIGAKERYQQNPHELNKNISVHIASTSQNVYLPEDYVETISDGKPEWWIRRFVEGSFSHSEGAVYPTFSDAIVSMDQRELINRIRREGWKVLIGADFGIKDPTCFLFGAIEPVTGYLYIYQEYSKVSRGVSYHAQMYKQLSQHIPTGQLMVNVGDPSGAQRSKVDKRSLFSHYQEYGINFKPGDNRIETGILKVTTYFELGKVKILDCCQEFISEGLKYRFKEVTMEDDKESDKPIDKDNHLLDCFRYMCQELPDDPDRLVTQAYGYLVIGQDTEDDLPWELRSDNTQVSDYQWQYY